MDLLIRFLILFAIFLIFVRESSADTYTVKIGTEHHVNVVDSRFLSFTVDPKYLFAGSEKYQSQESTCMATALSPAYIRIAGPSTAAITFSNSTISFTDLDHLDTRSSKLSTPLSVSHTQLQRFVQWAASADFSLVFALNSQEKTSSGIWDPNAAISILTVADQANVSDIYWQLGYECQNQTIEEYLNDLETLRLLTETFPRDHWRVVAGDVTPCLSAISKSDFKDYVTLSEDLLDAVLLNGNSSAHELDRMSENDRLKLLKVLSKSETPLWLTESANYHAFSQGDVNESGRKLLELRRAADWMSSLGYSARNGFAVHYRELVEDELYEPSLSFYMALLFKNLVGERVLEVTMEASQAVLFAHCTSLRRKPIPGAVTLFGANMNDEPARMAVKLSRREEGGDIMQFILAHDANGNIIVNGRAMYHEGDIRPVVKRVRPYKTLLLNLPPRSFGFWVLANTNIDACHELDDKIHETEFVEAITVNDDDSEESNAIMTKKTVLSKNKGKLRLDKPVSEENLKKENLIRIDKVKSIKERVKNINSDLKRVRSKMFKYDSQERDDDTYRVKRQAYGDENEADNKRKLRRQVLKSRIEKNRVPIEDETPLDFIKKIIHQIPKLNGTRHLRHEKSRKLLRLSKNKLSKRNSKYYDENKSDLNVAEDNVSPLNDSNILKRKRRSILIENQDEKLTEKRAKELRKKLDEADSAENEIDSSEKAKLWRILRKIHKQLEDLPENESQNGENTEPEGDDNLIMVKTKLSDDSATIKFQDKLDHGLVKSTVGNVMSVLKDLNKNLNKFWGALSLLE